MSILVKQNPTAAASRGAPEREFCFRIFKNWSGEIFSNNSREHTLNDRQIAALQAPPTLNLRAP
jgi:hypothetical protein